MQSLSNPYDWQRVNTDLFYGETRIALAGELVRRLINGQSFGITGGRRMGKTTLLRRVEKDLLSYPRDRGLLILPVYIEALALSSNFALSSVYQEIANYVSQQLNRAIDVDIHCRCSNAMDFISYLQSVVDTITSYRLQIIFLFDEVEPIIKTDWGRSFFANWRSLLHNTPGLSLYISAVFAGASEMFEIAQDIGSPLGNILVWREMEPFSQADTAKVMCEPCNHIWPDNLIINVYDLTGGHPFLIQYVMQTVYSYNDTGKALEALNYARSQFLNEQRVVFQAWWDKFNNITPAIYTQLVQQGPLPRKTILTGFGEAANRALSVLAHTGVIYIDWETDHVVIAGSLFKEWFSQFAVVTVTPTLADQVDSLLKQVERQLRSLLANHLDNKYKPNWLQQRIKSNPKDWNDILKRARKPADATLANREILVNTDLGYLFDLVLLGSEWTDLGKKFMVLSPDARKARVRLEERKDHLVFVRNKLRHVNEDQLTVGDLLKAQVFCLELLEVLSLHPG